MLTLIQENVKLDTRKVLKLCKFMKSSRKVLYKLQVTPQSHDGMNNKLASLTVQLEHSTRLQRTAKGTVNIDHSESASPPLVLV